MQRMAPANRSPPATSHYTLNPKEVGPNYQQIEKDLFSKLEEAASIEKKFDIYIKSLKEISLPSQANSENEKPSLLNRIIKGLKSCFLDKVDELTRELSKKHKEVKEVEKQFKG